MTIETSGHGPIAVPITDELLASLATALDTTVLASSKPSEHAKVVVDLEEGHGRNRTMTANIERYFDAQPGDKPMLVIVGRDHVPGMRKLLVQRHGYDPIDLE